MTDQQHPVAYDHDTFLYTCATMSYYGGSFASRLADAALAADMTNRGTLLVAFAGLFYKYGPESDFYKAYVNPAKGEEA